MYIVFQKNKDNIITPIMVQNIVDNSNDSNLKIIEKSYDDLVEDGSKWEVEISSQEYKDYPHPVTILVTENYNSENEETKMKHWFYKFDKEYELFPITWRQITVNFFDLSTDTPISVSGNVFEVMSRVNSDFDAYDTQKYHGIEANGTSVSFYAPYYNRSKNYRELILSASTGIVPGMKPVYWDYVIRQWYSESRPVGKFIEADGWSTGPGLFREYQDDIRLNFVNTDAVVPEVFQNFDQRGLRGSRLYTDASIGQATAEYEDDAFVRPSINQRFFPGQRLFEANFPIGIIPDLDYADHTPPLEYKYGAGEKEYRMFTGNVKYPMFLVPSLTNNGNPIHPTDTSQEAMSVPTTVYTGLYSKITQPLDVIIHTSGTAFKTMQYVYTLEGTYHTSGYITEEY